MASSSFEERLKALKETIIPTDDLVPIAELVQSAMQREKLPRFEAAGLVLDSLVEFAAAVIYFVPDGERPRVIDRETKYRDPGHSEGRRILSMGIDRGAIPPQPSAPTVDVFEWLRKVFSQANCPWDFQGADRFCILKSDAEALLRHGEHATEKTKVVQPAGGCWPHKAGAWTDEEKVALRLMRVNGLSDVDIAKVAGCERQVIGQQIGSKTGNKAGAVTRLRLAGGP